MDRFLVSLCLVALQMSSKLVGASPVDGGFIFRPDDNIKYYDMPASCTGQTYCFEKDDKYPEDTVNKLLENMPVMMYPRIATVRELNDNPDCPANTTYVDKPIYYILDENDQVRVVVQSAMYQQIYSVKWCQRPGIITEDTTNFIKGSRILEKYKIECVNTFMDFEFFVLNEDYGVTLEVVRAKGGIPVCCRCKYSNDAK